MVDAKEMVLGVGAVTAPPGRKKPRRRPVDSGGSFKRPEGMHRELYALLANDHTRDPPTLTPTDTSSGGYKQSRAKIGRNKVREWARVPFTNPARKDLLVLRHYRRVADAPIEYPFARFNVDHHDHYSDEEYNLYLAVSSAEGDATSGAWTREETDHLFDLSRRFDQRFVVMTDRWDSARWPGRSMEDLKERYYAVVRRLAEARTPPGQEPQDLPAVFDAQHEKNRKEQLIKLFERTEEQVEEEERLVQELKRIEGRKKERDKKSYDIHKLISAAESNPSAMDELLLGASSSSLHLNRRSPLMKKDKQRGPGKKSKKRRVSELSELRKDAGAGIKFPDVKGTGVYLRGSKLKMPASVGNKKSKAVEQLLEELSVDVVPMPTEQICNSFNELRNQLLLLYELRQGLGTTEYELQTLRHRYELMCPGRQVSDLIGWSMDTPVTTVTEGVAPVTVGKNLLIDAVATPVAARKRRTAAALLENNPWKKTRRV